MFREFSDLDNGKDFLFMGYKKGIFQAIYASIVNDTDPDFFKIHVNLCTPTLDKGLSGSPVIIDGKIIGISILRKSDSCGTVLKLNDHKLQWIEQ